MSNFATPVGRHVYGDLFKGSDKGFQNAPNPIDPETNKPGLKWAFGFAIEKKNPELNAFIAELRAEHQVAWPRGQFNQKLTATTPAFSHKMIDGDAPENKDKAGYAGCIVFKFDSKYPPTVFAPDGQRVISNPEELKRGFYFKVLGSITTNGNDAKPGMKMYHNKVMYCYEGEEIKGGSGFDADAASSGYRPAGAVDPGANPAGFTQDTQQVSSQAGNVAQGVETQTAQTDGVTTSLSSGDDFDFLSGQ